MCMSGGEEEAAETQTNPHLPSVNSSDNAHQENIGNMLLGTKETNTKTECKWFWEHEMEGVGRIRNCFHWFYLVFSL